MTAEDILDLINALRLMNPGQRRAFFRLATRKQIRSIEEACLNLIKNPVGVPDGDLARARAHVITIKKLANRDLSYITKRNILQQKGGFLGALLPVLGSLVASFIAK
jgi:hypothetical protein